MEGDLQFGVSSRLGPTLPDSAAKVNELHSKISIDNNILILDVSVINSERREVVDGLN